MCMCMRACLCMCICMCMFVYVYVYMFVYLCMFLYVYAYTCMFVYVYAYMFVYVYVCVCIITLSTVISTRSMRADSRDIHGHPVCGVCVCGGDGGVICVCAYPLTVPTLFLFRTPVQPQSCTRLDGLPRDPNPHLLRSPPELHDAIFRAYYGDARKINELLALLGGVV